MIHVSLIALGLVAATVAVHAAGLSLLIRRLNLVEGAVRPGLWPVTWLLVRTAWALILIHVVEISLWAIMFHWNDCLPDWESAFYFSGTTYTTIGYGDLVLPDHWRMLGPVEGLAGILMCGLSGAFFFAMVSGIFARRNPGG